MFSLDNLHKILLWGEHLTSKHISLSGSFLDVCWEKMLELFSTVNPLKKGGTNRDSRVFYLVTIV